MRCCLYHRPHFLSFSFCRKSYYPADAYAQSKLAQILFTRFVDAQLKEREDYNVCIYAVHPGVVNTDLFDSTGLQAVPWFRAFFFKVSVADACGGMMVKSTAPF